MSEWYGTAAGYVRAGLRETLRQSPFCRAVSDAYNSQHAPI